MVVRSGGSRPFTKQKPHAVTTDLLLLQTKTEGEKGLGIGSSQIQGRKERVPCFCDRRGGLPVTDVTDARARRGDNKAEGDGDMMNLESLALRLCTTTYAP
jgi:hypothetical protein